MITLSDPATALSFEEWGDDNYEALAEFGYLPKPGMGTWQDWGACLGLMRALSIFNIPDPYQFTDWREWAIRLVQALAAGA